MAASSVDFIYAFGMTGSTSTKDAYLALWDWRRAVSDAYRQVRDRADNPIGAWHDWREARLALFNNHPQSPFGTARRETPVALPFFDYDADLRFAVALTPAADDAPLLIAAGNDGTVSLRPFATTDGLRAGLGRELTLYWIALYGGGVFLPFGDPTNRQETYGGGRYLLDTIKGADLGTDAAGRVVLDFNFAYNPSCAYSDAYICPLTPEANKLPTAIRAGEKAARSIGSAGPSTGP